VPPNELQSALAMSCVLGQCLDTAWTTMCILSNEANNLPMPLA
jgi:hypothetical protein